MTKVYYSPAIKLISLINNKELSDVSFLVGPQNEDQKMFYGHKFILSMASPVFEKMFLGALPENKNPIKIPDISPVGFMNIIKYIYGEKLNFPLHELYETFICGHKYMVKDLCEAIYDFLMDKLNQENVVLIYDQLVKIRIFDEFVSDELLDSVRLQVDKLAFDNGYFNKISEDTLIDILSMEYLDADELLIIKCCMNWANESKSTIEDKRTSFKSIIPYINFSRITFDNLKEFKQLDSFLSNDDLAKLFYFLVDRENKPYPFEIKTKRKQVLVFDCMDRLRSGLNEDYSTMANITTNLSVNRDILISSIETSLPSSIKTVKFVLSLDGNELDPPISKLYKNDLLVLVFPDLLTLKSGFNYRIEFTFDQTNIDDYYRSTKNSSTLNYNSSQFVVNLNSCSHHWIEKIKFVPTDNN